MKPTCRFLIPVLLMFAVAGVAYAGGWAIVTVNNLPDYAVAGQPLNLTFSVRQHGVTLLNGLKPTVRASTTTGLKASAPVTPTANKGEYSASLALPQPGDWKITIQNGFDANPLTLPALKVIQAGSPAPRPFAENTRGGRLFVAKGCVGCHRHQEINPKQDVPAERDLTTKRYPHDQLEQFLANPSVKTEDMPNLNLKRDEIVALAAFLNKASQKKLLIEREARKN